MACPLVAGAAALLLAIVGEQGKTMMGQGMLLKYYLMTGVDPLA